MTIATMVETVAETNPCRLCAGATNRRFTQSVLGKYPVGYWQCESCGSLQTDRPYWLSESYESVAPVRDTGMVARTIQMAQATSLLLRIAGAVADTSCLDFGGGNGLFCRMMRDQGYDFRNYDKYAEPYYCVGFDTDLAQPAHFDVVTSFELFEHLPEPAQDLQEILALEPKLWILSTQLYRDQTADWSYLASGKGAHVFFYSARSLHTFARKHGYLFMPGRQIHLFLRLENNPLLKSDRARGFARRVLTGSRLATLASVAQFAGRQRQAYLRWQADRDSMTP